MFFEGLFTKDDVFLLPIVCYVRRDGGFVYDIQHKTVLFHWALGMQLQVRWFWLVFVDGGLMIFWLCELINVLMFGIQL